MKIKKVKWRSHPILGNLELDFTNYETGDPFDTILLAGENGTGKTSVLETISSFLNLGSFEYFDFLEFIINGVIYKAIPQTDVQGLHSFYDIDNLDGNIVKIRSDRSNSPQNIEENIYDIRHYGCVFSRARADYKTQQIRSTTTKMLDIEKYDVDNEDDFTSSKQLIVDVEKQDNAEYVETNRALGANPMPWNEFYQTSKLFRFKNAFDNFFEKLKYEKIFHDNSEISILFKKNNKSIAIDKLSTGEKQIVFRGIYLLKNSNNLSGAAIMIDEPELSMHPKWQKNIFKYYKNLFKDAENQRAQIFFATHSEHVLKGALENKNDNLIILLNDADGVIQNKRIDAPSILPSITAAETNYLAFDIVSNDYHIELYGWLQEKETKNTIKLCDNFIKNHPFYDVTLHSKSSMHNGTIYDSLSTYIRNAIHHPGPSKVFSEVELRTSIQLLIKLCM